MYISDFLDNFYQWCENAKLKLPGCFSIAKKNSFLNDIWHLQFSFPSFYLIFPFCFFLSTISTSDRELIERTYMDTPTTTSGPESKT